MSSPTNRRRRSSRLLSDKYRQSYSDSLIYISGASFKCPICSSSFETRAEFKKHYEREVSNFLSGAPSKKNSSITTSTEPNERSNKQPYVSINQRNNTLKSLKKRKYERFSNLYLHSFKNNSKSPDLSLTANESTTILDSSYDLIPCAMCNEYVELQNPDNKSICHLAKCFSKRHTDYSVYSSSEDEDENEESSEEFSWAGQTWVRTSSLLGDALYSQEGNLMRLQMADGDEILDVDGDDSDSYGGQQFSEADVIPCAATPSKRKANNDRLRQAVCSNKNQIVDLTKEIKKEDEDNGVLNIDYHQIWDGCHGDKDQFISKIKETVESRFELEIPKCGICMGPYHEPVVSTNCWHVCCSSCWLRALGAKKLCPKCNQIVSPSHLRKIYL